jgi:hypothetical protein
MVLFEKGAVHLNLFIANILIPMLNQLIPERMTDSPQGGLLFLFTHTLSNFERFVSSFYVVPSGSVDGERKRVVRTREGGGALVSRHYLHHEKQRGRRGERGSVPPDSDGGRSTPSSSIIDHRSSIIDHRSSIIIIVIGIFVGRGRAWGQPQKKERGEGK